MTSIETECIVLRTYDLKEADKIVVLFSREHGVVRGVAKGVKRLKSRFGSSLEPFSIIKATYNGKESAELFNIERTDLIESNFAAASVPSSLETLTELTGFLLALSPPGDPNEALFRMVRRVLGAAVREPEKMELLALYFEVWLLRLTGFLPEFGRCSSCGRDFDDGTKAGLTSQMAVVCSNCGRIAPERELSRSRRDIAASAISQAPEAFAADNQHDVGDVVALSSFLVRMIGQSAGRELPGTGAPE